MTEDWACPLTETHRLTAETGCEPGPRNPGTGRQGEQVSEPEGEHIQGGLVWHGLHGGAIQAEQNREGHSSGGNSFPKAERPHGGLSIAQRPVPSAGLGGRAPAGPQGPHS